MRYSVQGRPFASLHEADEWAEDLANDTSQPIAVCRDGIRLYDVHPNQPDRQEQERA